MRRLCLVLVLAALCWWIATSPPPAAAAPVGPSVDGDVAVTLRTASRFGLRVGDVLDVDAAPSMAHARRLRVAAVWEAAEHPADAAKPDPVLLMHLPDLQHVVGRPDQVDRIVVRTRPGAEVFPLRDDLNALRAGFDAYAAADLAQQSSRAFLVISRFHRAISLITLVASGIFLMSIMSLKLSEMRREVGALRLLGVGSGTIALLVVGIAAIVSILGTLAGAALGAVMVRVINAYYQGLFTTTLRFAVITPGVLAVAAALSAVLGAAAGVLVSVRLLAQRPLEQMGR